MPRAHRGRRALLQQLPPAPGRCLGCRRLPAAVPRHEPRQRRWRRRALAMSCHVWHRRWRPSRGACLGPIKGALWFRAKPGQLLPMVVRNTAAPVLRPAPWSSSRSLGCVYLYFTSTYVANCYLLVRLLIMHASGLAAAGGDARAQSCINLHVASLACGCTRGLGCGG